MAEATREEVKKRHRSPSYPTIGLREGVDRLGKFYKVDGKAGAPPPIAVKHMGYGSAHGAAYSALSALKKFGLVAESNGRIVPTQRALEIVNLQETDPRRIQAIKDAAVAPAIYRQLIDESPNGLPGDDSMESELVTYKDFNPNAVKEFVKDFKDTLEFAGLSDFAVLGLELGKQEAVNVETTAQFSRGPDHLPNEAAPAGDATGTTTFAKKVAERILQARTRSYSWALSGDFTAKLDLLGEPTSKEDLESLRDYVDITIKALTRTLKKGDAED